MYYFILGDKLMVYFVGSLRRLSIALNSSRTLFSKLKSVSKKPSCAEKALTDGTGLWNSISIIYAPWKVNGIMLRML